MTGLSGEGRPKKARKLVRIVEGLRGSPQLRVEFVPRFDYGEIAPWIYRVGNAGCCAVGSNAGLLIYGDVPLQLEGAQALCAEIELHEGQRFRLAMHFVSPEELPPRSRRPTAVDQRPADDVTSGCAPSESHIGFKPNTDGRKQL